VNTPIFLNYNYYLVLKQHNVDLSQLSYPVLKELLPENDFWELNNYISFLLLPGNLLYRLGFQPNNKNDEPYQTDYLIANNKKINTPLSAVCSSSNIIICEDRLHVYEENDCNCMCPEQQTLYNILIALKKIKTFDEIKKTKQFELFYLS